MSWNLYPVGSFPNYRDYWQRLNMEAGASPLLDAAFIVPLLEEFGTSKELLACYRQDNQIEAMAILTPRSLGSWETFQPSQAPIGIWIHRATMEWSHLLSSLIEKLPGFTLAVGVTQQDPNLIPRPQGLGRLRTLDHIQTAKIDIHGSFQDYWNERGKNLRHNLKKQRNNFEKKGITTRVQVTTAPEEIAQALEDYGTLESAGWKAGIGTAIHPDNAQGRFYRKMLEAFCERRAGRIYRLWYNDRIVSMLLCVEGNDAIVFLKTTYDESLKDGTSPAALLRQEILKQLFDEGRLKSIEFYGKATAGNLQWSKDVRTIYHVNAYRYAGLPFIQRVMKKPFTALALRP